MTERLLTINTGSSSLKAALFRLVRDNLTRVVSVHVERIGATTGRQTIALPDAQPITESSRSPDHAAAFEWVLTALEQCGLLRDIVVIGHRIVHGGPHHSAPEAVSGRLIDDLRDLFAIDPEHLPQAVAVIDAAGRRFPDVFQAACFDTHFHQSMPDVAKRLPLPRSFHDDGVRRYGFHGLSYESIMAQLKETHPVEARGRVVIAHLGAGASMAAVRDGQSVDTTMGFTPTGGLMMGTRPGDLDPGLLLYLLQARKLSPDDISRLLNQESGLLGVSGTSQDVRDLLAAEATDHRAAEAIALFCQTAKKHLAGLAATLGGLETLVFTGGIGEHSAPVRQRICANLEFLGVSLDPAANAEQQNVISALASRVTVRVMPADEELTVARHTAKMISHEKRTHVAL